MITAPRRAQLNTEPLPTLLLLLLLLPPLA
eukprot:COSAG01_NODE_1191_length_11314_cov_59.567722_2_plen_30_part_00